MAEKSELGEIISQTREYLEFYRELGLTEIGGSLRTGAMEEQIVAEPSRAVALNVIRDDIGDCKRCRLCEQRTNIVFGEGNPNAELMFVGEGPGADEDRQGRPFVGKSGQLLTKIIESIGYKREDCYIANVVKCRPPENRTPQPDEIATCEGFLFRQIAIIQPKVIVALGLPSAQTLLKTKRSISSMRGQFQDFQGAKLMPTFHPAYLLRSPDKKREVWEDMKKVRDYLAGKLELD
jgi:uracil-DNA glycosylase family 4